MAWWKYRESGTGAARGGNRSLEAVRRRIVKESRRHRRGQAKRQAIERESKS